MVDDLMILSMVKKNSLTTSSQEKNTNSSSISPVICRIVSGDIHTTGEKQKTFKTDKNTFNKTFFVVCLFFCTDGIFFYKT